MRENQWYGIKDKKFYKLISQYSNFLRIVHKFDSLDDMKDYYTTMVQIANGYKAMNILGTGH
jgi:hypothetical protein